MNELSKQIKLFITQQVELYGDDPAIALDQLHTADGNRQTIDDGKSWDKSHSLAELNEKIKDCRQCGLAQTRHNFIFGEGNPNAAIVLVGEAPGADEDRIGKPFVGAAGQLLTKILAAIHLSREEVYICNVLKCRPPHNRNPLENEVSECEPYLLKQIELINPRFILCMGLFAAQTLLRTTQSLGALRGQVYNFQNAKLLVTYHPAALLRFSHYKRAVWEDVQLLRRLYDEWKESQNKEI